MDKDRKMRDLMEAWKGMEESLVSRTPIEGPAMVEAERVTDAILVDAYLNTQESDASHANYEILLKDLIADWATLKSTIEPSKLREIIDDSLPEYLRDTYNIELDSFTWKYVDSK
jgi:hypothetical protein